MWEGSVTGDLGPGEYEIQFDIDALALAAGSYELSLALVADGGLRTTVALEPSLVVPPDVAGGPIVAAGDTGRITKR